MEYTLLGSSQLRVSRICLGTMTFGHQNSEREAHAQLDYALERGVNFIDTAEIYPVPLNKKTQGLTEQYIGTWLRARGVREKVIVASKVAGPGDWVACMRPYEVRLNKKNIVAALEQSLQRLGTDYIDLYQLHWPDRNCNYFGKLGYEHDEDDVSVPLAETLSVLQEQIEAGKIRAVGVSNETAWGTMQCVRLAEKENLPRIVAIQNPYNLLNRSFEINLAEVAIRADVPLLSYSPLAFGVLSGKYLDGARPRGARLTLYKGYKRYTNANGQAATERYVKLCKEHGCDPAQTAIAWQLRQPFVGSVIIGATTDAQLASDINSAELQIPPAVMEGIEAINTRYPLPCP